MSPCRVSIRSSCICVATYSILFVLYFAFGPFLFRFLFLSYSSLYCLISCEKKAGRDNSFTPYRKTCSRPFISTCFNFNFTTIASFLLATWKCTSRDILLWQKAKREKQESDLTSEHLVSLRITGPLRDVWRKILLGNCHRSHRIRVGIRFFADSAHSVQYCLKYKWYKINLILKQKYFPHFILFG